MKNSSITVLAAFIMMLVMAACKKDSSTTGSNTITTPPAPDECTDRNAVNSGDIIAGKYIVAYTNGLLARMTNDATIARTGADLLSRNSISSEKITALFAGEPAGFIATLSKEEAARLESDPSIQAVEPDRIIALGGCFTVAEPRLITWNIERVGYGNGIGKTAWIIDTGIDMDHPDLTVNASKSKSFISGIPSADDENGHGTHVAGVIGGKNNTIGVLGVASGATLVSLRVLGANGEGTLSSIIQALAYVNTNGKAGDVVNMSLGEDVTSPTLNQQVLSTASRGIFIAMAAGNDAQPANKFSPGNTNGTNIYTVSAVDSTDKFATFSNYGNDVVDFAAPGVRILSTFSEGRYAYLSGTSMATPHVAGLLLLKGSGISSLGTAKNDPDGNPDRIAHY